MLEALPQLVLNGLALGAAHALVALGFVLVINAVGAVNFAQGDFVMAGGFVAVALASVLPDQLAFSGLLLLPAVLLCGALMGVIFSWLAYFPLRHAPPVSVFISTIAVGIILQQGANGIFGAEPRSGPPVFGDWGVFGEGGLASDGFGLSSQQWGVLLAACVLVGGTDLLLSRTQFGRGLRATAQDPEMARTMGINVVRSITLTFAIAIALAAAAGALLSNQFFVTPTDGGNFMLKAYIAATLGGWGRVRGAAIAALLIGLFEVVVAAFVSYVVAEALLYVTVLLALAFRPQGLFGETIRQRA
jgi:branched-chain amino acid transport system permease protein